MSDGQRGLVVGTDIQSLPGRQRIGERRERGVHDEQRRIGVIEHEVQLGRRHAHVERREHAAGQHDAVVRLEHLHRVAAQVRDPLAPLTTQLVPQRMREAMCPVCEVAVRVPPLAVDHALELAEQAAGPLEEVEGRERDVHRPSDPTR